MITHFFLFPDDLSEAVDTDFRYEYKVGLLDTDASFFLTATYSDEAFEAEVERISGITCTVNDGNEDHTQAVIYDEDMYRYPAYIAIDGYCHTYEYALIDEANNRVIYVLTSYPDPEHLKEYSDFLKNDPKAYDLGNTSTLDRFCIYSVKMIDFDGYVVYDEE